jgi:hypothetical protein
LPKKSCTNLGYEGKEFVSLQTGNIAFAPDSQTIQAPELAQDAL